MPAPSASGWPPSWSGPLPSGSARPPNASAPRSSASGCWLSARSSRPSAADLAAERKRLHGKIDQLERRLAAKERKLARVQAFDAERRTLEPAPTEEDQIEGQLTFDAVSE